MKNMRNKLFIVLFVLGGHLIYAKDIDINCEIYKSDSMFNYYRLYISNPSPVSSIVFSFSYLMELNYNSENVISGKKESNNFVVYTSISDDGLDHMLNYCVLNSNSNMYINIKVLKINTDNIDLAFQFYYRKLTKARFKKIFSLSDSKFVKELKSETIIDERFIFSPYETRGR